MNDENARLLAAYDRQLRTSAEAQGALALNRLGPLWLVKNAGGRGFITYRDLDGADADGVRKLVAAAVDHYRADPAITTVEWKTRGHDHAPELHESLLEHGFTPEEPESIMIGDAAALAVDVPLPDGVALHRVEDEAGLRKFCELEAVVFGIDAEPLRQALQERLAQDDLLEVWIAEADGVAVSGGRLEPVPGTEFAGIWGGATRPGWRGRGIYRALTAARARSAIRLGRTMINSDSTEGSRPILERYGFIKVSTTTPYQLTVNAAG
ncbi:GNAT family N-acetyltransferase [Microlunatus parietis]|uniref:GNAT superfamily N-acetyltransferase n=1 Tax=Microlunatus parietis TaxID=682979 RepID=A0A7Y9IAV5_9ACTN|nr:GNAT family N-acetyltransferase [Microlunatus parietis]NYE72979.1 GNAT superfamily N-acetyltransferase [Microlunatus parietis]